MILALWSSLAEAKKPPAEVVFTFGWAPGDVAVETSNASFVQTGTGARESRGFDRTRIDVRRAADGLGLSLTTLENTNTSFRDGVEQPLDPVFAAYMAAVQKLPIDVLVTSQGVWRGLANDAVFRYQLDQASDAFVTATLAPIEDPEARARTAAGFAAMRQMMSPDAMIGEFAGNWLFETQFWVGGPMVIAKTYEQSWTAPHGLTGTPVKNTVTFVVTGVGPCGKGARGLTCADLDLQVMTDPTDLAEAARIATVGAIRAMQAEGAPVPDVALVATHTEHYVGRVEVATTRPRSWTVDKVSHTETVVAGASQVADVVQHSARTWAWEPRP